MYGSNLYFKTPLHTLISVLGFASRNYGSNYGSNYGKLMATPVEREAKRIKRKNKKQAQKRNRRNRR